VAVGWNHVLTLDVVPPCLCHQQGGTISCLEEVGPPLASKRPQPYLPTTTQTMSNKSEVSEMSTESGSSSDDDTPYGREALLDEMVKDGTIARMQVAQIRKHLERHDVLTSRDLVEIRMPYDVDFADDIVHMQVPRWDVRACRACDDLSNRGVAHKRLIHCRSRGCSAIMCGLCKESSCRKCRRGDKGAARKPRHWRCKVAEEEKKEEQQRSRSRSRSSSGSKDSLRADGKCVCVCAS